MNYYKIINYIYTLSLEFINSNFFYKHINIAYVLTLYAIKQMKKINWVYISITIFIIGFLLSWLLLENWKIALLLGVISGLITLAFNPVRRYMKAFWSILSLLITLNTFSLNFVFQFISDNSFADFDARMGTHSVILSISLVLLCIILLILDFLERNEIFKLNIKPKKEKALVTNRKKVKKQINIKKNKGKIEM